MYFLQSNCEKWNSPELRLLQFTSALHPWRSGLCATTNLMIKSNLNVFIIYMPSIFSALYFLCFVNVVVFFLNVISSLAVLWKQILITYTKIKRSSWWICHKTKTERLIFVYIFGFIFFVVGGAFISVTQCVLISWSPSEYYFQIICNNLHYLIIVLGWVKTLSQFSCCLMFLLCFPIPTAEKIAQSHVRTGIV